MIDDWLDMGDIKITAGGKCDLCEHHQSYHENRACSFSGCNCGHE